MLKGARHVRPTASGRFGAHVQALLAVAFLTAGATPVIAQPRPRVRLAYVRDEGAEHCPDAAAVRAGVAARLGWDPFDDGASRTLTAQIRRHGRAVRATMELTDETGAVAGRRQLEAADNDCVELAASLALAITIAVDPQAALRPASTPTDAPAEAAAAEPAPPASAPAAPAPVAPADAAGARPPIAPTPGRRSVSVRSTAPHWTGRVTGGLALTVGATPGGAVAASAGVAAKNGLVSAGLEGRVDLPSSLVAPSGGVVTASIYRVLVAPCLNLGPAEACALGSLGALHGAAEGVRAARSDTTVFALAGGRVGIGGRVLPPLWLGAHADLEIVATPTALRIGGAVVHETSPVVATVGGRVGVEFP